MLCMKCYGKVGPGPPCEKCYGQVPYCCDEAGENYGQGAREFSARAREGKCASKDGQPLVRRRGRNYTRMPRRLVA